MMRRLALALPALALAACLSPGLEGQAGAADPEVVRLPATDLAWPLLVDLAQAYREVERGVVILPQAASLAELHAAGTGLAASPEAAAYATPIGYVTLEVVVHPVNPLTALSRAQVREIFLGRANEWGQVGGPNGVIHVVARPADSEAAAVFAREIRLAGEVSPNALVVPGWEAMHQSVAQDSNAIGYLVGPEVSAGVKRLALEAPLRVLVVAVAPAEPQGALRAFLAWAQGPAGQAVVARRGQALDAP